MPSTTKRNYFHASLARRGFASLIGLLLVLVIISVLLFEGYLGRNPKTGKINAETYIDHTKETACTMNRNALESQITATTTMNGGQMPSPNVMRAKLGGTIHCPGKGKYQIDPEGHVYCTEHAPAPESRTASIVNLEE